MTLKSVTNYNTPNTPNTNTIAVTAFSEPINRLADKFKPRNKRQLTDDMESSLCVEDRALRTTQNNFVRPI